MNKADRFIRIEHLMQILNVSRSTCYRLIEAGCFVAARFGGCLRISLLSVEDYVNRQVEAFRGKDGMGPDE
jgi:excisionase family DNA binding protein